MILTLRTICHYRALGFSLLVQPLRQGQASDATDNYVKLITPPSRLVTMTRGSRSIVPMLSFDAERANLNVFSAVLDVFSRKFQERLKVTTAHKRTTDECV